MKSQSPGQNLLENAYQLETPQDSVEYYNKLAASYDEDFAGGLGYYYPAAIAAVFGQLSTEADFPIADIGCGTGLVAEALGMNNCDIDGMDISPSMLRRAGEKAVYRSLYEIDLTAPLPQLSNSYGAVVSAGTFTSGHLGPAPLENLLCIARPGGLFVIGINKNHFAAAGFAAVLDSMQDRGLICNLKVGETAIYSKQDHEHSDDMALVLSYRKA
jgi:predicted TPR repeat methyltransferase